MSTSAIVIPSMLTRSLDMLPDLFSIQTYEGFILYANPALAKLCGLRSPREMIEKKDTEIPSRLYENHDSLASWHLQDKKITEERESLSTIEIHPESATSPYLMQKKPFYDNEGKCVAVFCTGKYLEVFIPNEIFRSKLSGSLLLTKPSQLFTEKECEIIFCKLQGMSSKETGQALSLSHRTVENRLANMYDKAGVNNFHEFRHYCETLNFHYYLPQKFLTHKLIDFNYDYSEDIYVSPYSHSTESNTSEHSVKEKDYE